LEVKFDFSYGLTVPVSQARRSTFVALWRSRGTALADARLAPPRATQADYEIHTTLGKLRDLLLTPVSLARSAARLASRAPDTSTRRVTLLDGCRGALRPGSLTLLLSPPGHGKTTLLKALAGLVPPAAVEGNGITYNGLTAQQLAAQGTQLKLLANYVDQLDTHLPFLTVRETLEVRRAAPLAIAAPSRRLRGSWLQMRWRCTARTHACMSHARTHSARVQHAARAHALSTTRACFVHACSLSARMHACRTHAELAVCVCVHGQFACLNSTVEPAVMGDAMLTREAAHRVDRVLKLLHLEGCADTLVGNDLVRGVSGGEKKRVTVAEALVSNARLFCMDEISTGLDASVTYDIVASIRAWAHEMRGTVIVALLQPTPEVYDLFDDVMLLREGSVVYHGPRTELPGYLAALGFTPPGAADEASSDMADWLVELLASPGAVLKRQRASGRSAAQLAYSASTDALLASNASTASLGSVWDEDVPRTTAALAAAWAGSAICAARMAAPAPEGVVLESAFAKRQYGHASPRSGVTHFRALLARQFRITARNSLFVTARMVSAIVISIILGTFWYDLSMSQGLTKFGMLLFSVLQLGFANMGELPYAVENKYVGYKHMSSGMYPAWAYSLAASLVQLPVAAVETAAFSVILYFMVGLVNDGGRWAMFYLIALLVNLVVGSLFRLIAYMVPTAEAAQTAPGPFIALQVIFAGFLVAPSHMGSMVNGTPWLLFMCVRACMRVSALLRRQLCACACPRARASARAEMPVGCSPPAARRACLSRALFLRRYYATMFAYPLRSLAHNEFLSPPYDIYPSNATGAIGPSASLAAASSAVPITEFGSPVLSMYYPAATCDALPALDCGLESYGVQTLRKLNIDLEPGWKWGGVGFLLGMVVLLNVAAAFALSAVRITRNVGSSRAADEHEPAAAGKDGAPLPAPAQESAVVDVAPAGSAASVLPFQPMTVSWRDVKYTVQLNKNLGGGAKTLLQGVSGIAQPGRLIALMGASGAGKSTLLDVIAGRKTAGAMEGGIFLNGFAREEKSFARLTAYCEQQDIHNSFATVREALAFSAALRLPRDVDAATRDAFVEEVVDMLKLRYIAHRMVGEVGAANGLSPGQRKILTMGVELVSNAPILFLVRRCWLFTCH
jgi:ABC-type multidrug transport system ATPase subunit